MLLKTKLQHIKKSLAKIYNKYHHLEFVKNDPVYWLHNYNSAKDQEIVGLISALFAFGNVKAFNKKIKEILNLFKSPSIELPHWSRSELETSLSSFKHRFVSGLTVAHLLYALRKILEEYSSIKACFREHYEREHQNLWLALQQFSSQLRTLANNPLFFLVPAPEKGGACKRLCLYLRWMVRKDEIDIGYWDFIHPNQLIVPLDTHIYHWATSWGIVKTHSLNVKTAIRITEVFQYICPDDPLRYDFSLCQAGMLGYRDKILYYE
ncbi:MAG: TIGR02757 family protein [Candidatus Hydrogenedens sp.]|nr:TIGR02757 family protein [Candidatus Hydrogenedens sp.]